MIGELNSNFARVENEKAEQRAQFETQTNNFNSVEASLKQEICALKEQVANKLNEISFQESKMNELNSQIESLSQTNSNLNAELDDFKQRLNQALTSQDLATQLSEQCQLK